MVFFKVIHLLQQVYPHFLWINLHLPDNNRLATMMKKNIFLSWFESLLRRWMVDQNVSYS